MKKKPNHLRNSVKGNTPAFLQMPNEWGEQKQTRKKNVVSLTNERISERMNKRTTQNEPKTAEQKTERNKTKKKKTNITFNTHRERENYCVEKAEPEIDARRKELENMKSKISNRIKINVKTPCTTISY